MKLKIQRKILMVVMAGLIFAGCAPAQKTDHSGRLQVIATTSIVGDVVKQVGGDLIDLQVLLPVGNDPHSFQPTPQDVARVAESDIVFANGVGLEGFLDTIMENAGGNAKLISVSDGIALRQFEGALDEEHGQATPVGSSTASDHAVGDPHVWTDPNNVKIWVENIATVLSKYDPAHAANFQQNAEDYQQKLDDLDTWIKEQVSQVPAENRKLVTDHLLLGYFADRYGFTQIGSIIPGYSTMAEPSAKELAMLEDHVRNLHVRSIFVGNSINPSLAKRVAEDTDVSLVYFYTGSLSEASGPAATYLDYVRYNVNEIVSALK